MESPSRVSSGSWLAVLEPAGRDGHRWEGEYGPFFDRLQVMFWP